MSRESFSGKVVIVTGASSGIGEQLSHQLAARGAILVLAARSEDNLRKVADDCLREYPGTTITIVPTDVSSDEQCRNLIETTVKQHGRIDVLINNAGLAVAGRFRDMQTLDIFEKVIRVNFFGGVYCTHHALPYLIQSGGRLVAVSSMRGKLPSGTADGYGAAKHAMAEFYASLRNELSDTGVSVTVVFPNWVKTGLTTRALKSDGSVKGEASPHEAHGTTPEKCAKVIIRSAERRRRDVYMTLEGKMGMWLRMIFPALVDGIMKKKTEQ